MSTAANHSAAEFIRAAFIVAPDPWHAVILKVDLPATTTQRNYLHGMTQNLVRSLRAAGSAERSIFLQMDELHKGNAVKQISAFGRMWAPEFGLGMYPNEAPPRYWNSADFLDRDYKDNIPALMHSVCFLDADESAGQHACDTMTGTAGLIQVLHQGSSTALRKTWFDTLQPTIQEPGLAAYPLYVPLLGGASLACSSTDTSAWMGTAEVYLRESNEDGGVYVLCKRDITEELRKAGFHVDEPSEN